MDTERLTRAIALARAGQKEAAREILETLVHAEPTNEIAWLWLADTQSDDLRRVRVLREAQKHLPRSLNINKALAIVNARLTSGTSSVSTPPLQKPAPLQVERVPHALPPRRENEEPQPVMPPGAPPADEEPGRVVEALRRQSRIRRRWPFWTGVILVLLIGLGVGLWVKSGFSLRSWVTGRFPEFTSAPAEVVNTEPEVPVVTAKTTEEVLTTDEPLPAEKSLLIEESTPDEEATTSAEPGTPTSTPVATPTPAPLWINLNGTPIHALAWAPRANLIALATSTGVFFYNADDLARRSYMENPVVEPRLALSGDGRWLVANGVSTRLWKVESGEVVRVLSTAPVTALTFSADNVFVALAESQDKAQVRVLWVNEGQGTPFVFPTGSRVFDTAFSPDGSRLAVALDDGRTLVWNLGSGTVAFSRIPESGRTLRLAFSPRGDLLAAGNEDGGVWLWDGQGNEVRILRGPVGMIFALAFSPDGSRLAASGEDPAIFIWNVADGQLQTRLEGHTAAVVGLRFAPQGEVLLSASEDGTARFWDLKTLTTP